MNYKRGIFNFVSLLSILSAYYIQPLAGKREILRKGTCFDFYETTWKEPTVPTVPVPLWSISNNNGACTICNSLNRRKSWLATKVIKTNGSKLIHVKVNLVRASCPKCASRLGVYILHKKHSELQSTDDAAASSFMNKLKLFASLDLSDIAEQKETLYDFEFEPKSSIFLMVFLSEGICTRILDLQVSYFVCGKNISKGVNLPRTLAPASGFTTVNVSCPTNTLNPRNEKPYGLCSSRGTWNIFSPCMCKEGYTLATVNEGCKKCSKNTYKDVNGNGKCMACPLNSFSSSGEKRCRCKSSFYRFIRDNYTHPCYGVPSSIKESDIKFTGRTETTITLLWQPAETHGSQNVLYDIECRKCQSESDSRPCELSCGSRIRYKPSQYNIEMTNVTVLNLEHDTEYQFNIYSKNNNSDRIDKKNWGKAVKKIKTKGSSSSGGIPQSVAIAVPVIVVALMIIIIVLIVCLVKRRKIRQFRRSQRLRGQPDFPLLPGEKNYIDPTTYDNPEKAVLEFTKELDRNLIKFEAVIGGGEFGDVYKGEIKRPGQPATKVAIKTLKPGCTRKNRTDFLIEASVMGQFKNLNVITLEGVVTKSTPLLIVTEYMENGSLDKYLKLNDGLLKPLQLLGMARGCASGMEYLAGMHFVHRDLAARNILVNTNLACKVADFGLSRDIGQNEDSEYETQGGKIPVRWTAPEAITYRKFSTASDVWSYGILLWEIMSFAERPYWNWGNEEVMKRVDQGYRLPPPMHCPKIVHQLMKECWLADRTKRPPFKEIVRILDEWLKNPEKLNEDYIKVRRTEPLDYSTFTSVKDWLEAIKMGMYASNFAKAGYEELSDVAKLTEDELLKKVGVRLVGHRNKIYQRIKEMSEEMMLKREQSVRI